MPGAFGEDRIPFFRHTGFGGFSSFRVNPEDFWANFDFSAAPSPEPVYCGVISIDNPIRVSRVDLETLSQGELEERIGWLKGAPNVWRHDPIWGHYTEFEIDVPDISSLEVAQT
jgi:hypothetical protein